MLSPSPAPTRVRNTPVFSVQWRRSSKCRRYSTSSYRVSCEHEPGARAPVVYVACRADRRPAHAPGSEGSRRSQNVARPTRRHRVAPLVLELQALAYRAGHAREIALIDYGNCSLWLGVSMGAGTGVGDAVKSFFKRQIGIAPGASWIGFDQLDFFVGTCSRPCCTYRPCWRHSRVCRWCSWAALP